MEPLPQLICLIDSHGKMVRANCALDAWGLDSAAGIEGAELHQMLHPGCVDTACYLPGLMAKALQAAPETCVLERVFDPRLNRHLNIQALPFLDKSSAVPVHPLAMVVLDDLSERAVGKRSGTERERQTQRLVEFSPDMMVLHKFDGTMRLLSPASSRLLGYAPEQLIDTDILALVHPDEREALRRNFDALMQYGEDATTTCRMRCADGNYLWIELISRPVITSGESDEIVSLARNVTEYKAGEDLALANQARLERAIERKNHQLERAIAVLRQKIEASERDRAALASSEQRYNMLLNNTLTGIYVLESDRVVFCNERFARIFDSSADELCGLDLSSLGIARPTEDLAHDIGREEVIEVDTMSGARKWIKLSRAQLECGETSLVLGNVIDISEQVQIYERLKTSEHELHGLSAQLIAAQENERKRIANELHDGIGQRLSAIKFAVENIQCGKSCSDPALQAERLAGIVMRLRDAIEEIRRVSMDLRPSSLDDLGLIATLGWFCREFGQVYPALRISRQVDVSETAIPEGLKLVIFRIIQEAMHNIAKHAAADEIGIHLVEDGRGLCLSIQDDGRGFDYAKISATGTGLGLKSMHERAELTGGEFAVISRQPQGTQISVCWPRQ